MKDRNGEEVSKGELRRRAAQYRAQSFGGTEGDYLNGHGGSLSGYRHGETPGNVVAEYIYQDKNGEPYLKVERTENKQFPQYHWKPGIPGSKNGRWESGAPDGPKIPYGLPQLISAPLDKPVFICEGEKDADAFTDLFGLKDQIYSTCCSEGTRSGVWTSELNEYFKGREKVYIIADNDRAGWAHAQRVARNLVDVVGEVRIIKLPGLALGGDLSDWIAAGGTKEQLLKLAQSAPKFRKRPTIHVAKGEIARAVDDLEHALTMAKRPVFKHAFGLVTPVFDKEKAASKGRTTTVTLLKPFTASSLIYMVNKWAANFTRYDSRVKKDVPIDPPPEVIKGLLERGHWGFPIIAGAINTPTMRPDGSILDQPGYDAATHLWLWSDEKFVLPRIPPKPSKAQATAALEKLKSLLTGFPFVNDVDRSVAISAILTAVLRGAFPVAPLFLFLAHTAGTGKSFLVDVVSHVAHAQPCPVITASKSIEEAEKRLGAIVLEGTPMVSLDNCSVDIEGDFICQMVDRRTLKPRILGKSESPSVEWGGMLLATGNNIRVKGDAVRRTLTGNLDAGMEQPETRRFAFDPIERIMEDRASYVAAALTIGRAYFKSGEGVNCEAFGSYGDWSRFAREPLIWLGEVDPLDCMKTARTHDPERKAARDLIEQWARHLGSEKAYRVSEIIKSAGETAQGKQMGLGPADWEHVRPEFHELLMTHAAKPNLRDVDPAKLGQWLGRIRGQVHDVWRIEAASESESHGNKWVLVKATSEPTRERVVAGPRPKKGRKT
jgi:hypothetical protein